MRIRFVVSVVAIASLILLGAFWLHSRKTTPAGKRAAFTRPKISQVSPILKPVEIAEAAPVIPQTVPRATQTTPPDVNVGTQPVQVISNLQGNAWARQKAARALPKNLSPEQVKVLIEFLRTPHPEDEEQVGHVLKNDLMDALVAQQTPSIDLTALFTAIYRDSNQNAVVRDYAVQHLALLSERLDQPTGWEDSQISAQRGLIQETLWEVVNVPESSIAGTALLGLTRLSENDPSLDRDRLQEEAFKSATAATSHEAAKITALQVCARLQVKEALPFLVNSAQQTSNIVERISAIGALGLMGGRGEAQLLETIVEERNPRLEPVAMAALRRIRERSE